MLHFVERRGKFKQEIKYRDQFLRKRFLFIFLKWDNGVAVFFPSNLTPPPYDSFSLSERARETATVLFLVSFLSSPKLERSVTREEKEIT